MGKDGELEGLQFETVEINFIYSFFISKASTTNKSEKAFEDILTNSLGDEFNFIKRERGKENEFIRLGIPPNLRVHSHEFYKYFNLGSITEIKHKNCDSYYKMDPGYTSMDVFVRIMETGIGTITFRFVLTNYKHEISSIGVIQKLKEKDTVIHEPIISSDIYKFYDLINGADNLKYEYPEIRLTKYPFCSGEKPDEVHKRIKDVAEDMRKFVFTKNTQEKGINVTFLDTEILDNHKGKLDEQNPYVVLVGRLSDNDEIWLKDISNYEDDYQYSRKLEEINLLLFRYIKGSKLLEEGDLTNLVYTRYSNPKMQSYLHDYSWFKNMFVASHPRTTLILYQNNDNLLLNEEYKDKRSELTKPILNFIKHSTLDLFELSRMRWHFFVVLNEILDLAIQELLENLNSTKKDFKLRYSILVNRQLYAESLSDPLTYSFGGALVFDLIESAKKFYQLDYLMKTVELKLNTYDKLFIDYLNSRY